MKRLNSSFFLIEFPKILLILLPGFLITGPFLPDLSISIIALFFLIYCILKKNFEYFNNFLFRILFIFYLWILICSLFSENVIFSLSTSVFYIRFLIFSVAVYFFLEKDTELPRKLFFSFSFFFLILIFDSFFQYFTNYNILGWQVYEDGRISSFFGKELILGSYFSRLLPFFLGLYYINISFLKKKKFLNYISLIIILSAVFCIFISAERASVLFFFISFFSLFFLLLKNRLIIFLAILLMLFSFLISYTYKNKTYLRLVNHTVSQLESQVVEKKFNLFNYVPTTHRDLYKTAFNMFDNNKFFGIGPKVFRIECKKSEYESGPMSCNTHPHNTYLQLLAETGLVGFLLILFIFLILIYNFIKHLFLKLKNKILFSDPELCFLSMIFITLWPLVPSGNFFGNWLNVIYYFPIGFIMYNLNKKRNLS
jgi:O-antigen ligase